MNAPALPEPDSPRRDHTGPQTDPRAAAALTGVALIATALYHFAGAVAYLVQILGR